MKRNDGLYDNIIRIYLMKAMFGLIIIIGCLLIAVYAMADYVMPDVICKIIPRESSDSYMGQYNSHLLSDICSGAVR